MLRHAPGSEIIHTGRSGKEALVMYRNQAWLIEYSHFHWAGKEKYLHVLRGIINMVQVIHHHSSIVPRILPSSRYILSCCIPWNSM